MDFKEGDYVVSYYVDNGEESWVLLEIVREETLNHYYMSKVVYMSKEVNGIKAGSAFEVHKTRMQPYWLQKTDLGLYAQGKALIYVVEITAKTGVLLVEYSTKNINRVGSMTYFINELELLWDDV